MGVHFGSASRQTSGAFSSAGRSPPRAGFPLLVVCLRSSWPMGSWRAKPPGPPRSRNTEHRGVALMVDPYVADALPVYIYDRQKGVIKSRLGVDHALELELLAYVLASIGAERGLPLCWLTWRPLSPYHLHFWGYAYRRDDGHDGLVGKWRDLLWPPYSCRGPAELPDIRISLCARAPCSDRRARYHRLVRWVLRV